MNLFCCSCSVTCFCFNLVVESFRFSSALQCVIFQYGCMLTIVLCSGSAPLCVCKSILFKKVCSACVCNVYLVSIFYVGISISSPLPLSLSRAQPLPLFFFGSSVSAQVECPSRVFVIEVACCPLLSRCRVFIVYVVARVLILFFFSFLPAGFTLIKLGRVTFLRVLKSDWYES